MLAVKGLYDLQEHILYRYIFFQNNKKPLLYSYLDWNKTQICQEKFPHSLKETVRFAKESKLFFYRVLFNDQKLSYCRKGAGDGKPCVLLFFLSILFAQSLITHKLSNTLIK